MPRLCGERASRGYHLQFPPRGEVGFTPQFSVLCGAITERNSRDSRDIVRRKYLPRDTVPELVTRAQARSREFNRISLNFNQILKLW